MAHQRMARPRRLLASILWRKRIATSEPRTSPLLPDRLMQSMLAKVVRRPNRSATAQIQSIQGDFIGTTSSSRESDLRISPCSIQSIKCASCVASHRVCEIDRNAIDTRLPPGVTLKFSKQTTLDAVLASGPVQPTRAMAPITSYDQLLDHMSDMDRPYYMYLSSTASKPTKDVLSWLEDVFNPCGTKVDGGELCYKVKIGNRANINPFTAIKYAQHVPLPYKIKPQSPLPHSRPTSPLPLRSVPPAVDTQPCSSSDQISASSVPPNHDVFSGLKRKFALANPHAGRYLASNKLTKTASGSNVLALSPVGRYDDAEIDERFGDADSTRREEEYEYQTDHSSDDDDDNESVEGRGQDHGASSFPMSRPGSSLSTVRSLL